MLIDSFGICSPNNVDNSLKFSLAFSLVGEGIDFKPIEICSLKCKFSEFTFYDRNSLNFWFNQKHQNRMTFQALAQELYILFLREEV